MVFNKELSAARQAGAAASFQEGGERWGRGGGAVAHV